MTVSVRRALALSFFERYALIILGLGSNMVLARLLTPEQIGIYSVSLAVIGIAQVMRDFGIGTFLIQERNLEEEHVRSAFGLALLIGVSLFVAVFAAAPAVSRFYSAPELVETLRISAVNFLILPFCTISLALLRREMRFDRLIKVTLASTVLSSATTIGSAYLGHGPNSMAIGSLVGNIATGVLAFLSRENRMLITPSWSKWRALLHFGGQSSLIGILGSISMDANDLVVGKILGFHPVAILSRAQGLMNLLHRDAMSTIKGVALPAFAAAHREGADMEAAYRRSVSTLTALAWPFYGLVSLYAFEALRLLFGPQWDEARPLVPIFCAAGAVGAISSLIPTFMIAAGAIQSLTKAELMLQPMRLALIFVAAMSFGTTQACAIAYLASAMIALPVIASSKSAPRQWSKLASALGRSLAVSVATLTPAVLHVVLTTGLDRTDPLPVWQILLVLPLCAIAWIAGIGALHHSISREEFFEKVIPRRLRNHRSGK